MDLLASLNTHWSYSNNLAQESMLPLSPMEDLAFQISSSAKTITEYLKSQNQRQPSFDRDTPNDVFPRDCPQEIIKTRQSLIEASLKIFQLATGPGEFLPNLAVGVSTSYKTCLQDFEN
jgi:6-hydroxytryprostatin B O-methyltransferase